jgi:hypothetical protein
MTRREFFSLTAFEAILPWRWFRRDPQIAGIRFRELRKGDGRHYIHIHGDEKTAFEVLTSRMATSDGCAFFIRSGERNVDVAGGKIDPNRMWSRAGAEKSLRSLNQAWSDNQVRKALDELDDDREKLLRRLLPRDGGLIIALHNNGPGYSAQDEVAISDSVALRNPEHPDEFMLCTSRADYEVISGGGYNVLLQNKAPKDDDGSLSRLCAARNIRYVNIEAAHGNLEGQRAMLTWVEAVL